MARVYPDAGLFSTFNLPIPTLNTGDLQPPAQFPQSDVSSRDIGIVFP